MSWLHFKSLHNPSAFRYYTTKHLNHSQYVCKIFYSCFPSNCSAVLRGLLVPMLGSFLRLLPYFFLLPLTSFRIHGLGVLIILFHLTLFWASTTCTHAPFPATSTLAFHLVFSPLHPTPLLERYVTFINSHEMPKPAQPYFLEFLVNRCNSHDRPDHVFWNAVRVFYA